MAFSVAIERAQAGSLEDLAQAQRVAHTLKGSANTVGVRGIASLTHRLEDLLQLLDAGTGTLQLEKDAGVEETGLGSHIPARQ